MATYLYGVIIYIIILLVISGFCIKKALNSFEEYSYCGRSLAIHYIMLTFLGTWIGGGTIVGLIARGYAFGANQYWVIAISGVVELFFAIFFIKKIRTLKVSSIIGFFALKYPDHQEIIRIPVAIGLLIRNATMVAMQFTALSYMITFLFGIDRNLATLLIFLIITLYTVLSGLWGVVMTDVLQGLMQTGALVFLAYATLKFSGGMKNVFEFYQEANLTNNLSLINFNLSIPELISYLIAFGAFFLMGDQSNWERIYASKTDRTAIWGFIIPITIILMSLVLIVYMGVFQRVVFRGEVDAQLVLFTFIFDLIEHKYTLFILLGLIAAIMSSADSFLLASGILFSGDIVKPFINKGANDRELIFWARAFVIVTGAIGFAFSIIIDDILFLWITGVGMASIILVPGYFLAWFSKKFTTAGVVGGMLAGLFYVSLMAMGMIPIKSTSICVGIVLNFIVATFFEFIIGGSTGSKLNNSVEGNGK